MKCSDKNLNKYLKQVYKSQGLQSAPMPVALQPTTHIGLADHRPLSPEHKVWETFTHSYLTTTQGNTNLAYGCLSCQHRSQVSSSVGDPRIPVTRNLMGWAELASGGGLGVEPHLQDPLPTLGQGCIQRGSQSYRLRRYLPKLLCAGDIGFGDRFGEPAR